MKNGISIDEQANLIRLIYMVRSVSNVNIRLRIMNVIAVKSVEGTLMQ